MARAGSWFVCRVAFVEVSRAITLAAGDAAAASFREEWPSIAVVEVDQQLSESAAALAREHDLRSLDALHLAAALVLPPSDLVLASWDRRLHAAAERSGLTVLPHALP
jgi:uncharacterized protein